MPWDCIIDIERDKETARVAIIARRIDINGVLHVEGYCISKMPRDLS